MQITSAPLVSVIIPAYNCHRYVGQAIESILDQDYANCEIIVIDDGSTDATRQVLEPYFDRIRYIYQDNRGVSAARNRGIQEAKGDLVALLDADDFFLPGKLSAQVACFVAKPDLGIVHSGWQLINEQGDRVISKQEPWLGLPQLDLEAWILWRPVFPGSMMFRRVWLDRAGGFDPRFPPVEDVDLALRLAAMGCQSTWLKQITVAYRQHEASATTQNTPKQARSFDAVYNHFFAQANLSDRVRQLEKAAYYNYLVWMAWRFLHTRHLEKMVDYLQQAIPYTPFSPTETIANWVQLFNDYAAGAGEELDVYILENLPEWRQARQLLAIESPRISVIIPTYNRDRYIQQAIESVLHQTYENYEILVVDDGSTDNTVQVLQPYSDRIRYIYQENQGAAAARNRALRLARGEFIAFLDSDDWFLPEKLAAQIACFDANPALDLVQTGWLLVDRQGKTLSQVQPWHDIPQLDLKAWVLQKIVRPSAMMVRREWCQLANGFDDRFPLAEDLDFVLRLSLMGCKAAWVRQIHSCYRQHDDSLMTAGEQVVKHAEMVMEAFFDCPDLPDAIRQLKSQERYGCLVWLAWRMYHDGYLVTMVECLEKSLSYTPFSPTETVLNWVRTFSSVAAEYGEELDVYSLTHSAEWQQVLSRLLVSPSSR